MGDLVELNRKNDSLTVEEVMALVEREDFNEIVIAGMGEDGILYIWSSEMEDERAHWFCAKAASVILRES